MANNLIITCGTSQVDEERLRYIEEEINESCRWSNIREEVAERSYPPRLDDTAFQLHEKREGFVTLVGTLCEEWPNREEYIGSEKNPYGAELSTLVMIAKKDEKAGVQEAILQPSRDCLTLLSSQTHECAYCTAVVGAVMNRKGGIDLSRISRKIVPSLNENPADVNKTTRLLAKQLSEEINEAAIQGLKNVLVITGGYKSIIPCLTIFSLVFGIEMYYLFEKSKRLQFLNEALVDESEARSKQYWKDSLEKLREKTGGQFRNECLEIALEAYLERPERPY